MDSAVQTTTAIDVPNDRRKRVRRDARVTRA